MYKNQLQELAQRSCSNLPSYACIREGPDHAPRFKATVNFNGEVFESPGYCSTLRQAEHAAAEVALMTLSRRGPPQSLAARILDETGVCKNLLQETAQRAGVSLPAYMTIRSGPGHLPIFTCTVEVSGMQFMGEAAKTKKQAEKNAAMAAWSALKVAAQDASVAGEMTDEQEQNSIVKALALANSRGESILLTEPGRPRGLPLKVGRELRPGSRVAHHQHSSGVPLASNLGGSNSYYPHSKLQHTNLNVKSGSLYQPSKRQPSHSGASLIVMPSGQTRNASHRQDVPSMEEHTKDEEEWLGRVDCHVHKEPSRLGAYRKDQVVRQAYNPSLWSSGSSPSQWWGIANEMTAEVPSSHLPALAPPVRLRTMQPVHASPPLRIEGVADDEVEDSEATRQVLSQLSL
eukprot:TRINITY_DN2390_c0_g1_i1.p1 TRINITY_DN2390_c0_g1~~TRINITY_DN2390_c0_g1_i1.p1  ORF type:complete len:403 (-),score=61.22 TRINITY_DN2390_c0_g1_i1:415-1623(-)